MRISHPSGDSTRNPTTSSRRVIGSDGSRKYRTDGSTALSKVTVLSKTCDFSLIVRFYLMQQYTEKLIPSIVVCSHCIIHVRFDALLSEFRMIGSPNFWILVCILDKGSTLFDRGVYARSNGRYPDSQRKLLTAAAQRQLQRRFRTRIEMLVKPVRWRAEHATRGPVDFDDPIALSALVGSHSPFVGPHERVAFRTKDNEDRPATMIVRFVIAPHRPFGQMADQGIIGNLELRNVNARPLLFLRVDSGFARVGNEICLPDPLPVVSRKITMIANLEVIAFSVIAIAEYKIAIENKLFVVKMVQHHRRRRDRNKNSRIFGVIDETMRAVQRRGKKTSGLPTNRLRHATALLEFRNAFTLNDVNDFFVQMLLGFGHRPGRHSPDVNSGDSLQTSELKISSVTAQPV